MNLQDDDMLAVIDPATDTMSGRYAVEGFQRNHGMALDPEHRRAFLACQGNNVLAVFDLETHRAIAHVRLPRGADVVKFDPGLGRVYVAFSVGAISVIQEDDPDHFRKVEDFPTTRKTVSPAAEEEVMWRVNAAVCRMSGVILVALGVLGCQGGGGPVESAAELTLAESVPSTRFDFETKSLDGWQTVDGRWAVEDMAGAPSGQAVLVQRAVDNAFNVIGAPGGPYTDVDVSVRFKPISGAEDASAGIVFRFAEGRYYVIRANALEGNFRLYSYDHGRSELASARVQPPSLGEWHALRVVAIGDHIQGYLDGKLLLDHRDRRFRSGAVGVWTKADSITPSTI